MANITKVYLLNVPLERDYLHTLHFDSQTDQLNYFAGRIVKSYTDFNYQRKEKNVSVQEHFDNLSNCNYLIYQNTAHSNKWYYCFINEIEYVNDSVSRLHIETDVIQTYLFDYELLPSFVEREHVINDSIGLHSYPESVEIGEYIINKYQKDNNLQPSDMIVIGSTIIPSGEGGDNYRAGAIYNGVFSGVNYYAYPITAFKGSGDYKGILQRMADDGHIDAVTSMFLCPAFLQTQQGGGAIDESDTAKTYNFSVDKLTSLNGYTPINKKLLTYPFCYLLVSNGNGASAIYNYELFSSDKCVFKTYGALTPGCSIRMIPQNYKGCNGAENEGLNLGKYPQCNWATDQYTNWLAQNGVNIATSIVGAGANIFTGVKMGALSGGPGGALIGGIVGGASGIAGILNTMQEVRNADRVPPQSQGNLNCGDVVTASGNNTFHYYAMSIKKEYAKIIDSYFSCYGYKVNCVKQPNTNHRKNYWYIKCIDVNIKAGIPQNDLLKIKECYNRGITFWRSASNIKNYNVSNDII